MNTLKNNEALYFDIWRKCNFRNLIKAYIKVAVTYKTKEEMRLHFGYFLDKYLEDGKGSYSGTKKQWYSAYTLGRELGVFYKENEQSGYDLSPLAIATLKSQITPEEYLLIYLLNLNQAINGEVVHPLNEVLKLFNDTTTVTKQDLLNIPAFNLGTKPKKNQNQLINVLLHRLSEANVLTALDRNNFSLNTKYSFNDLNGSINRYNGTINEFLNFTHQQYVEMLSQEVLIIPHYLE